MSMNDQLSRKVIGAAFTVHNNLGFGFLESVYEKALSIELQKLDVSHECQAPIRVWYANQIIGSFVADLFIDERLIVELKSVTQIIKAHEVQLVNYLVATKTDDGLLINFGPSSVDVRRKFRTYRKSSAS